MSAPTAPLPAVDEGGLPWHPAALWCELRPRPGRAGNTVRLVALVLISVTVSEVFRIPNAALAAYIVMFLSKEEAASTVLTALVAGVAVVLAIFMAIAAFMVSLAEPALRLPLIALMTFVAMLLARITTLGPVLFVGGFIIAYGLTLGDEVLQLSLAPDAVSNVVGPGLPELAFFPPEEALLRFLLWLALAVAVSASLVVTANLLTGRDPAPMLRQALAERLAAAASFCEGRTGADHALLTVISEGSASLAKLHHLAGIWRKRHARLPDASLIGQTAQLSEALLAWRDVAGLQGMARLRPVGEACRVAENALRTGRPIAEIVAPPLDAASPAETPLAPRIVRAMRSILATRALSVEAAKPAEAKKPLFAPDAFTNPAHARFAFKVTLAVMLCYLGESLADWPGIHTCIITCFFVSLGTLGESLHKMALRLVGCLVGAALGIGTILLLMPSLTDLGDLLVGLAVVTLLAGWIAAGSERVAYAGLQIGLAFTLTVLQGYGPTLDMETARDRLVGILIGNVVISVVFLAVWPVRVADVVRDGLARALEHLGAMLTEPAGAEDGPRVAFDAALAQARGVLAEAPYEAALTPGRRQAIDAAVIASVQALALPVAILGELRQGAYDATLSDAEQRMSAWLAQCAAWVRSGEGAADVAASLPALPVSALEPSLPAIAARLAWYHQLYGQIRVILARVGAAPELTPGARHLETDLALA